MMNVLGEIEKEKPCEFDFTRLFSSLMRIFDFGFSSYFRLGLDNYIIPTRKYTFNMGYIGGVLVRF
jgi:hypothetical protein